MAKYRKKLVVVDAVQWMGFEEGPHDLGIEPIAWVGRGCIKTQDGASGVVSPGGWIITNADGKRHCCPQGIFEATYELVEEPEEIIIGKALPGEWIGLDAWTDNLVEEQTFPKALAEEAECCHKVGEERPVVEPDSPCCHEHVGGIPVVLE